MTPNPQPFSEPRLTFLGKAIIALVLLACFAGAYFAFNGFAWGRRAGNSTQASGAGAGTGATPGAGSASGSASTATPEVTIGVAYGTEKKRWLTWAVEEFNKTEAGRRIGVNLIPMGSIESAHAILKGDQSIHVWTPASGLYRHNLVDEWQVRNAGADPIGKAEPLALSPMVFVMWEERYNAFIAKYKEVNFKTVGAALSEKGGWSTIAGKPEWGFFKFGHTHPNQSNSGLMTLVLQPYDFHEKSSGLTLTDITSVPFQEWVQTLQRGVTGLSNSTGNMMQEMVQRGPSTYDCLFVYENTAIDYLKNAEGRWGRLRIVYPSRNMWNDNPYYVLNVPWSTNAHRKAADQFLIFLLSEPVQAQALVHGFRPANVAVPINLPDGPFNQYEQYGLRVDIPSVCEPPAPEVINNLLVGWQRTRGK